jgi:hypothetical protein
MRATLITVLFLGLAAPAMAFTFDADRLGYSVSAGYAKPVGGDWAKSYRSSKFVGAAAEYDTGGEFRWGLELGYNTGHECKSQGWSAYKPKIFFIAPYLKEYRFYDTWEYYALIGMGLYHRVSNEYTVGGVTYEGGMSGKIGASGGFGAAYYLGQDMKIGLDLRLHYVRQFIGIGPNKASATNFTPSLTFSKKF